MVCFADNKAVSKKAPTLSVCSGSINGDIKKKRKGEGEIEKSSTPHKKIEAHTLRRHITNTPVITPRGEKELAGS